MTKTKKEIEDYVKVRKDNFIGTYFRGNKEFIYFYNKEGKFTGYIPKTKMSVNIVKRIAEPIKLKVRVKFKGERGKKTLTYSIYNLKQRDEFLFRMNKNLRDKKRHKSRQRKINLPDTKFREDVIPTSGKKTKIDLLFDKIELKPVKIEEFKGVSP